MKLKYDKAIETITDWIVEDMPQKEQYNEIKWLLKEVYPKDKKDELIETYNLDDTDQWGDMK